MQRFKCPILKRLKGRMFLLLQLLLLDLLSCILRSKFITGFPSSKEDLKRNIVSKQEII
jgi:hypothetical protein